ncbi:MAG: SPOR domain-containing protein, partial [Pseudomonadota bacterium]
ITSQQVETVKTINLPSHSQQQNQASVIFKRVPAQTNPSTKTQVVNNPQVATKEKNLINHHSAQKQPHVIQLNRTGKLEVNHAANKAFTSEQKVQPTLKINSKQLKAKITPSQSGKTLTIPLHSTTRTNVALTKHPTTAKLLQAKRNQANNNKQQNMALIKVPVHASKPINLQPKHQKNQANKHSQKNFALIKAPVVASKQNNLQAKKITVVAKPRIKKALTTKNPSKLQKSQNRYLLSRNKDHFTLQLIGLSKAAEMQRFIEKYKLKGKAHFFQTVLHGKPWFILVYGDFKTVKGALQAKAKMPADLQKYHPWIRKMRYVQSEIHEQAKS